MKEVTIFNKSSALTVGTKIGMADNFLSRLVGLLGRHRLDSGCGILICPSSGVHTIGMLFPIDVVALDKNLRVLKLWPRLRPFRITSISFKVHCVLELAAGEIERLGIAVGDELEVLA